MNKLFLAVLCGQHRHTYSDNSGYCFNCGKAHTPHKWKAGTCTICGFDSCDHQGGFISHSAQHHLCQECRKELDHDFVPVREDIVCLRCSECGLKRPHTFPDKSETQCGTCSVCGAEFGRHSWSNAGTCERCGYSCLHPQGDINAHCTTCGSYIFSNYIRVKSYEHGGIYVYEGRINNQSYYRKYGYSYDDENWVSIWSYLVRLSINIPTQFGGDYAYTASGYVFTEFPDRLAIDSSLLRDSGKYMISLTQYTLAGEKVASGEYTSPDCEDIVMFESTTK